MQSDKKHSFYFPNAIESIYPHRDATDMHISYNNTSAYIYLWKNTVQLPSSEKFDRKDL